MQLHNTIAHQLYTRHYSKYLMYLHNFPKLIIQYKEITQLQNSYWIQTFFQRLTNDQETHERYLKLLAIRELQIKAIMKLTSTPYPI